MKKIVAAVFLFLSLNNFAEDKPFQTFRFEDSGMVVKGHIWDPDFKNQLISFSVHKDEEKPCYFKGVPLTDKKEDYDLKEVKNTLDENRMGNDKTTTSYSAFKVIEETCNARKVYLRVVEVLARRTYGYEMCSGHPQFRDISIAVHYELEVKYKLNGVEKKLEYETEGRLEKIL